MMRSLISVMSELFEALEYGGKVLCKVLLVVGLVAFFIYAYVNGWCLLEE